MIDYDARHEFVGSQWREVDESVFYDAHDVVTMRMYRNGATSRFFAEVPPLPTEPGMYVDAEGGFWRLTEPTSAVPLHWLSWAGGLPSAPNPVGLRRMEPVT